MWLNVSVLGGVLRPPGRRDCLACVCSGGPHEDYKVHASYEWKPTTRPRLSIDVDSRFWPGFGNELADLVRESSHREQGREASRSERTPRLYHHHHTDTSDTRPAAVDAPAHGCSDAVGTRQLTSPPLHLETSMTGYPCTSCMYVLLTQEKLDFARLIASPGHPKSASSAPKPCQNHSTMAAS